MGILQVGAGGVGWVTAHKVAQHNHVLGDLVIAARTPARARRIVESIARAGSARDPGRTIEVRPLDAHDVESTVRLIRDVAPALVLNVGPPWVNVAVMEACARTATPYLDTSVAVDLCSPGQQVPEAYDGQWAFRPRFEEAGATAVLGAGFDPGVVSIFATYARKHLLDEVDTIDVMDVNAGDHGRPFATNFDPETNFLEIQGDSFRWEDGAWHRVPCHSRSIDFDLPEVGRHTLYSMAHDEVRSLAEYVPARRIEFWMGFGERYLRYFTVLRDLGLLSPEPVTTDDGVTVAPIKVVKAVLPDPTTLAPDYKGKTCIATLVAGRRDGRPRRVLLYNVCDHRASFDEVEAQAISYTAGVPAVVAALLMVEGTWGGAGVFNVEQLDPDPFLSRMPELGLDWAVVDVDAVPTPGTR